MTTPAGWLPAPDEPGVQRWWDGELWTHHRRPVPRVQYRAPDPTRPEPGWYLAPDEPGFLRYWEGTHWMDLRLPAPGQGAAVTAGQVLGSIATQLIENYVRPRSTASRPTQDTPQDTPRDTPHPHDTLQDSPAAPSTWQQPAHPAWRHQPPAPLPPPTTPPAQQPPPEGWTLERQPGRRRWRWTLSAGGSRR